MVIFQLIVQGVELCTIPSSLFCANGAEGETNCPVSYSAAGFLKG